MTCKHELGNITDAPVTIAPVMACVLCEVERLREERDVTLLELIEVRHRADRAEVERFKEEQAHNATREQLQDACTALTAPELHWDCQRRIVELEDALAVTTNSREVNRQARLRMEPVFNAALAWRIGRDRTIIGTAPAGGQRSETGISLIDAIDATIKERPVRCTACGLFNGAHETNCRAVERDRLMQLRATCNHPKYGITQTTGEPLGPPCCSNCGIELGTACQINPFWSGVCTLGTRSCAVVHTTGAK